ncbi:hypothetical protein Dsin_032675 [Dipteronia sinensis]|uniref:Uncharacterized protein n=1 Tax=Dipteronia sinensis TaxID=43782 RepID=A0AAE0DLJ9_9ROSI|nr:hypothetical protein Dsin_032675 [Dipteronia sinensis]
MGADASEQDKSTTMVIIRRHLHEDLKAQYLTVTEPEVLWQELKDRFDNQPNVALPNARITTQLKLCGQDVTENDMLEKTFTTFYASNMILQQQYRERRFSNIQS